VSWPTHAHLKLIDVKQEVAKHGFEDVFVKLPTIVEKAGTA
jgi:hypothetical protein